MHEVDPTQRLVQVPERREPEHVPRVVEHRSREQQPHRLDVAEAEAAERGLYGGAPVTRDECDDLERVTVVVRDRE